MRGIWIHGGLLLIALVWAFQTWTREAPTLEQQDRVLIWEADTASVVSVSYRSERRDLDFVRRTDDGGPFWWGIEVERPPASEETDPAPVAADTLEFPLGRPGTELIDRLARLRVVRDLGPPSMEQTERFGLVDPTDRVVLETEEGRRVLEIGGSIYAGSDVYVMDPSAGRVYVLPDDMVRPFRTGSGAVRERVIHYFTEAAVRRVRLLAGGQERVMDHTVEGSTGPGGWVPPDAPDRPDQTFANFMTRIGQLAISGFEERVSPTEVDLLLRVEYLDEDLAPLGFLELYRGTGDVGSYYVRSERTRVIAGAVRSLAETVAEDLTAIF
jgi:hypothetical protein